MDHWFWIQLLGKMRKLVVLICVLVTYNGFAQILKQPISAAVCKGNDTSLTLSDTFSNPQYQWQIYINGNWFNLTDDSIFSGSTMSKVHIRVSEDSLHSKYFRCQIDTNSVLAAITDSVQLLILTTSIIPNSISASVNPVNCPGNSAILTINGGQLGYGANWKWYKDSCNGTSIGSGASLSVSPTLNTAYFVRAEGTCNITNCSSNTITITNTNSIAPTSVSATVNPVVCPGNSTSLTVNGGAIGSSAQWKWYQGSCGGASIGSGSSISIAPSSTTNYFVRAEGICNVTNCATLSVTVSKTNSTKPIGISATSNPMTCPGSATTLSPNGGVLGTGAQWKWYSAGCGGKLLRTGLNFVDTLNQTNKYFLRAEGDCNTTLCDSITIVVSNANSVDPTSISATRNPVTCPNDATVLTVNGGLLGSSAQWRWYSDSCGKGSAIGTGTSIIVKPNISTAYYVRAEGPCAPTSCANTIIFVNNTESTKADSIVSTKAKLCRGEFATLSVSGGNLGTTAKWQWYENGCTGKYLGEGLSINVAPNNSTSYFVKAVGTCNITECTPIAIQVFDLPKIDAGKDTSVCSGFSIRFQTISNGSKFSWQPSIGLNDPNLQHPIAGPAVNTTYIVKTIDKNNCSAADTIFVQVNKNPKAIVSDDTAICYGDYAMLRAKGGVKYEWTFTGSVILLNNPQSASPLAQPTKTTLFNVVVQDINGCRDTASVKVIVNPTPIANAGEDQNVCFGDVVQLNASGGQFYQWGNHPELDFPSTSNPKVKALQTQNYIVSVGNIFGCTSIDSLYLIVNPLPNIITGQDNEICLGDSLLLVAFGGTQYRWSPEIGLSDIFGASTYVKPNQNVKYIVEGKDVNNCTNFDSIYITVNPLPILDVSSDVLLCKYDSIQLQVNGAKTYVWMPAEGLNQVDISKPNASPKKTTNFKVIGRSADGCSSMDSVLVQVIDNPIPRILSMDTIVCQNSFWKTYSVSNSANSKTWKVSGGNIITGQFTEKIKTHWTGSTIGKIYITESLPIAPYCFGSDSLKVSIRSEKAPDRASIIAKANNISTNTLICKDCDFEFTQWGYENTNNQIEINSCKGASWCSFNIIDTFNFSYWVKIGENENCLTKSYFNQPEIVGGFGNSVRETDLTIHPNPVTNFTQINANWPIEYVGVFNSIGQSMEEQYFVDFPLSFELKMGEWHSGVYFLVIKTSNGIAIKKVIRQ
jgi:hypothetical protein